MYRHICVCLCVCVYVRVCAWACVYKNNYFLFFLIVWVLLPFDGENIGVYKKLYTSVLCRVLCTWTELFEAKWLLKALGNLFFYGEWIFVPVSCWINIHTSAAMSVSAVEPMLRDLTSFVKRSGQLVDAIMSPMFSSFPERTIKQPVPDHELVSSWVFV